VTALDTTPATVPVAPDRAHPLAFTGRYLPALDGLRGVAVLCVFAYHLGYGWADGGYLGVDAFFVLSGFLITGLLIEEWTVSGFIRLRAFWARRARRLLPALITMLLLLAAWVAVTKSGTPIDLGQLRDAALSTIFYVANWQQIFAHQSYWAGFAGQSPLKHTWTLAIERTVLSGVASGDGGHPRWCGPPAPGARRCPPGAARSGRRPVVAADRPGGHDRGHAAVGGLDGLVAPSRCQREPGVPGHRHPGLRSPGRCHGGLSGGGPTGSGTPGPTGAARPGRAGAAAFVVCLWRAGVPLSQGPPAWMTDGGFLLVAVAVAAVIADAARASPDRSAPPCALVRCGGWARSPTASTCGTSRSSSSSRRSGRG